MFLEMRSPFKNLDDEESMNKFCYTASSSKRNVAVGLRIAIQKSQPWESHLVVKSTLKLSQPTSRSTRTLRARSLESSFLKSCYLCKKKLRPDKDTYMYRGDQGFCSVECRSSQIALDEQKEIEISTKHTLASIRYNGITGRCETHIPQEDYRRQHGPSPIHLQRTRPIFL